MVEIDESLVGRHWWVGQQGPHLRVSSRVVEAHEAVAVEVFIAPPQTPQDPRTSGVSKVNRSVVVQVLQAGGAHELDTVSGVGGSADGGACVGNQDDAVSGGQAACTGGTHCQRGKIRDR